MPIHVAITRKVVPGCERAFEESLRGFSGIAIDAKGLLEALA
jgi:antibiotic biosynthesis monooxygenase (ABM) superfamily enzyme